MISTDPSGSTIYEAPSVLTATNPSVHSSRLRGYQRTMSSMDVTSRMSNNALAYPAPSWMRTYSQRYYANKQLLHPTDPYLFGTLPNIHNSHEYKKPAYEANSFIGWHRRSLPTRFRHEPTACSWSQNPDLYSPGSGLVRIPDPTGPLSCITSSQPYDSSVYCVASSPTSSEHERRKRRNRRVRLWLVLCVMVVMVAILAAMAVAVYSQVQSRSAGLRYVRQYQGRFWVTDGQLLNFDPALLRKDSEQFRLASQLFVKKLDAVYERTAFLNVYEGAEVSGFRFINSVPALEVQFFLKMKIGAKIDAVDLLRVLDDAIRSNLDGIFFDISIDVGSLNIEGHNLHSLGTQDFQHLIF